MKTPNENDALLVRNMENILRAALAEVDPANLVRKNVLKRGEKLFIQGKAFNLNSYENIYLAAFGKAAPFMAESLARMLGRRLSQGIVVCRPGQIYPRRSKLRFLPAPHPLPDERSVKAGREILSLARKAGRKDLLFVLISGGGSAQVCLPLPPISLEEKRWITEKLLGAGADVFELNVVRKHLSAIKGGRLAKAAFPASIINLVISDVIDNNLEIIASGPTSWDSSTFEDAVRILKRYELWRKAPVAFREAVQAGLQSKLPETVKREDRVFRKVQTFIIGDNFEALTAAARKAEDLGFCPLILTSADTGEARIAAKNYVLLLKKLMRSRDAPPRPLCLLAGGELTVTVTGKGRGGRNTEFALASLVELMLAPRAQSRHEMKQQKARFLIASVGTDGLDGATDAAGAWVGSSTLLQTKRLGLAPAKYLEDNDSYGFFERTGGLVKTGPTRTNVMDLRIFLLAL